MNDKDNILEHGAFLLEILSYGIDEKIDSIPIPFEKEIEKLKTQKYNGIIEKKTKVGD